MFGRSVLVSTPVRSETLVYSVKEYYLEGEVCVCVCV